MKKNVKSCILLFELNYNIQSFSPKLQHYWQIKLVFHFLKITIEGDNIHFLLTEFHKKKSRKHAKEQEKENWVAGNEDRAWAAAKDVISWGGAEWGERSQALGQNWRREKRMKSQQEKICDGKTDMRIADEKIEGNGGGREGRGTYSWGRAFDWYVHSLFMLIQSFY